MERLRGQAIDRQIAKGELLFAQGDDSSELYVVLDGRIAVLEHRDHRFPIVR